MKAIFSIFVASTLSLVHAQVTTNGNGTFQCSGAAASKNFCAAASLTSNIIIRCSGTVGEPGNCNDNLAGVPPAGVKDFVPCYQSSPTAGDAACSYNGIAYPDGSPPFNISRGPSPSSSLSSYSSSTSSTSAKATLVAVSSTSPVTRTSSTTKASTTSSSTSSRPTSSFSTASITPYVPLGTGAVLAATTTTTTTTNSTSSSVPSQGLTPASATGGSGRRLCDWSIMELAMVAAMLLWLL